MTKEMVLNTFKEILSKSGMEEVVSLSENVNELADLMIYQEYGEPEYLAINGKPLFPLWEIRNILYQYGQEKFYNFVGSTLQFVIELKGDSCYVLEFGDGICEAMRFNGEWATNHDEIRDCLVRYNQKVSQRLNVECLFHSVEGLIEGKGIIVDSELREVRERVHRYMKENPTDRDFLLSYTYSALTMFVYEDTDLFSIKTIIRKIVHEGCGDDFADYIRQYSSDPKDFRENGYYLSLVTAALHLIREVNGEDTEE